MKRDFRKAVRPIIALGITGVVIFLGITGKIDPDKILTLFGVIAGFYFGERAANNGIQPPTETKAVPEP